MDIHNNDTGYYVPSTLVTMVRKSVSTFYRHFSIAEAETEENLRINPFS